MYIDNYIYPVSKRSLIFSGKMQGVVVKNQEYTQKDSVICVYIPKLMFGLPISDGGFTKTYTINTNKCLNTINKPKSSIRFNTQNFLTLPVVRVNNTLPPKYALGENVIVETLDRDIKNIVVLPYTLGEEQRRKDDKITTMVSNFKKFDNSDMTRDNTFGWELDSKNKLITIWTSKTSGEESGPEKGVYMISINAKSGQVIISDTGKRVFELNTDEDAFRMTNDAGSKIEMIGDTINMSAKTLNVTMTDEINLKSSKLNRKHDEIKTTATKDTEETDTMEIKGNDLKSNYNKTTIESSSYENKTSKWVTQSPISGFSAILTSASFSISPNAGSSPLPTAANFSSAGIMFSGSPCGISMGLARAQPLISTLMSMAAKLDAVGSHVGCPPTAVSVVASSASLITSTSNMG